MLITPVRLPGKERLAVLTIYINCNFFEKKKKKGGEKEKATRQSRFQTAVPTGCLWKAPGHNGQDITPIHTELPNKDLVTEALHRAKFKVPGYQKISTSKEWGLTKLIAEEFEDMVAETWLIPEDSELSETDCLSFLTFH
ncbi:hypothetical protein Celaphus_00006895 [Cervus elaphus hippelaphus]|uniref:Uncharacterized protein n=1 Tax=Cervus elaphus hippelaphus TaxID=46360 RepID=A0A212CZP8_CEREH|nr:hypothetical protein Celaphus_00006895 [Cervus elaphus hippelaphus]